MDPRIRKLGLFAAIAAHLVIVQSIASQPLAVGRQPEELRSIAWTLSFDAVHRVGPGADLLTIRHAGVQASRGEDLYAPRERPPFRSPYHFPYRYSPLVGETLGRALLLLSPRAAWQLWVVVLELALAGTIGLLRRRSAGHWIGDVAAIVLLLSTPFWLELHMGQFTFLTLALSTAALLAIERVERREGDARDAHADRGVIAAGSIAFALAVGLKTFPLVLAPALLRARAGRVVLAIGAASLAPLGLYFLIHPATLRALLDANFASGSLDGMDGGNHGLAYVLFLAARDLGVAWTPRAWSIASAAYGLAVLGGASAWVLRAPRREPMLAGATMLFAFALAFAQVWEHHASGVLVVALALLVTTLAPRPGAELRLTRAELAWGLSAAIALALPTPFALLDRALDPRVIDPTTQWAAPLRYLLPLSKALPTLALFALCARLLARAPASLAPRSAR